MAKRHEIKLRAVDSDVATTTPDLSAKVKKAIEAIRKPFTSFQKDFAALAISREELAPKFMKAFGMWQAETAGTFVEFIRYLVPDLGATRAEYRQHRAYQAADYLRRIVGRPEKKPRTAAERAAAPVPPSDVIARLCASLATFIPEERMGEVWTQMQEQLHWTPRQMQRLQTQTEHVDPLVQIRARVESLRLSFPAQDAATEAAA